MCQRQTKSLPIFFAVAPTPKDGVDVSQLDGVVQFFCSQDIAPKKTLTSPHFVNLQNFDVLTPFPVSEDIMCYFSSHLASKKLSLQTIKMYLSGICHMKVTLGLPEPRAFSSLPCLKLGFKGSTPRRLQSLPR